MTNLNTKSIVITCRLPSTLNNSQVEVADFDAQQIASFANKWFAATDQLKAQICSKTQRK